MCDDDGSEMDRRIRNCECWVRGPGGGGGKGGRLSWSLLANGLVFSIDCGSSVAERSTFDRKLCPLETATRLFLSLFF